MNFSFPQPKPEQGPFLLSLGPPRAHTHLGPSLHSCVGHATPPHPRTEWDGIPRPGNTVMKRSSKTQHPAPCQQEFSRAFPAGP